MLWSSLSPAWQAALEQAWQAGCAGSVPIGSVITSTEGEIVARGRNHIYDPAPNGQISLSSLAHAEVNALLGFAGSALDPHSVTLYTTTEPCPQCMGAIYMAGIRAVRYASRDPYAGSTDMLGATPYLSRKPVVAHPPEDPTLEIILAALVLAFDLKRWSAGRRYPILEEPFAAVLPRAVQFSHWLDDDDRLVRAYQVNRSAEGFFEWLAGSLEREIP